MGVLKRRKNKKYNYQPRYYKGSEDGGSPFAMKHKFDDYRSTVGDNKSLKGKFIAAITDFKSGADKQANRRILIIIGVLVLLFLFVIDFDLSIFFKK